MNVTKVEIRKAYNQWAETYDTNDNKTRDLEAKALRESIDALLVERCLEVGCGTGKNTAWLASKARQVVAVDFSERMLAMARQKITASHVTFHQADITEAWTFAEPPFDLITFSLVLEHVQQLAPILEAAATCLTPGGYIYIGELHPFKQYAGSKARFQTPEGEHVLTCFTHHVSDFTDAAKAAALEIHDIREYFDEGDRTGVPRILNLLFRKRTGDSLQ